MAWLEGWQFRKSITLSRASGAVTYYQMKLLVGESSGATGENVDCGGKCASDFDDIRFTTSDGTTLLDYWIESISGTTPNQLATIWIKFDSIGTDATTFYMYYGNSSVVAYSNGKATFPFFDDFLTDHYNSFTVVSDSGKDVNASQGICVDGTYIYTVDHYLVSKYDSSWTLITTHDTTEDATADCKCGDLCHYNGKLYVCSNYDISGTSEILVYDASDLSYIETISLTRPSAGYGAGSITLHDNKMWVVWDTTADGSGGYIQAFNFPSWTAVNIYPLTYTITGGYHYNGIVFVGDYLYAVIHESSTPQGVDIYRWNGTGFAKVGRIDSPTSGCTQGIDYDGTNFWFSERSHGGVSGSDYVVKASGACIIDPDIWTVEAGTPSVSNSIVTLLATSAVTSVQVHTTANSFSDPLIIRARVKSKHTGTSYAEGIQLRNGWTGGDRLGSYFADGGAAVPVYRSKSGAVDTYANMSGFSADTWAIEEIHWIAASSVKFYINDANEVSMSTTNTVTLNDCMFYFYAGNSDGGRIDLDWLLTRKYLATPPSWGSWSAEEAVCMGKLVYSPNVSWLSKSLYKRREI